MTRSGFKTLGSNNRLRRPHLLVSALLCLFILLAACSQESEPTPAVSESREKIVFADLNWNSAIIQNHIARFIIEHGYGYPTDAVLGSTLPMFQALVSGEVQVSMEIWLPNQQEEWDGALSDRAVIPVGKSIQDNWQSAFVVPTYVIEGDPARGIEPLAPDLKSVDDLRRYKDLFTTWDSGDNAVLVTCPPLWSCTQVNEQQVEAYGFNDFITLRSTQDQDALFDSLKDAYDKGEPWLGYLWSPTLYSGLELTRLEEPEYSDFCWFTTKACGYGPADVTVAVHPSLVQRAPDVIEFLRKWNFTSAAAEESEAFKVANDISFEETAIRYLKDNETEWAQWTTPEIAEKVKTELANR
jgi:glycine betaine/proline transport system substrate-binding protein